MFSSKWEHFGRHKSKKYTISPQIPRFCLNLLISFTKDIITACQRSCGKVMFSVMCVSQSVQGDPHNDHCLWCHWQSQVTWNPHRHVQTCSHGDPTTGPCPDPPWPDIFKLLHSDLTIQEPPRDQLESGQLTFDWKVFLFYMYFKSFVIAFKVAG